MPSKEVLMITKMWDEVTIFDNTRELIRGKTLGKMPIFNRDSSMGHQK